MKAKFVGKHKSMGYKNGGVYVLATTYDGTYWWVVDINGKGKPTPYSSIYSFIDNWEVIDYQAKDMESNVDVTLSVTEKHNSKF